MFKGIATDLMQIFLMDEF